MCRISTIFRRSALASTRLIFLVALLLAPLPFAPRSAAEKPLILVPTIYRDTVLITEDIKLDVSLDQPQEMLGPDDRTDNPFNTLGKTPNLVGYLANSKTYGFVGGSLDSLKQLPNTVIGKGAGFDSCGAWLNSAWTDGKIIRGWYHAETDCVNIPGHASRKSVAYAESYDGGHTFVKVGYPNNQVITAPSNPDANLGSEGDQHVIQVGGYFYMYFVAARDYQVRLARSSVADGGKPGTWYKYYNGSFSEPGLGGQSSPIASGLLTTSWVSYDANLQQFIGFSYFPDGYGFALSQDGINWQTATDLILPWDRVGGPSSGRNASSKELIVYPSLIGLDGDSSQVGADFWLYYMRLRPGEDFYNHRYLVRRKVHVALAAPPTPPLDSATDSSSPTGFAVSARFQDVWARYGGLPTFGYAISGERWEQSPTDGKYYVVQWFERNRFEYHPELGGDNVVEFGLLGVQATKSRNFPPAQPNTADPTNIFFSQTNHNLSGRFLEYWQQSGGLALYGYPISEAFTELLPTDGKTYLVQYFERARFEYHPENQLPYDVLLGLLGRQLYRP